MRLRGSSSVAAVVVLILAVLAIWGVLWALMFELNPQYAIRTLNIRTGVAKSPEEIRALTGLREGRNLFSFSAAKLREDLLLSTLNISEVEISKRLPDTVEIVVRDRIPAAKLGDSSLVVDRDGLVFTMLPQDRERYHALPVIEDGARRIDLPPGRRIEGVPGTPTTTEGRIMRVLEMLTTTRDNPEIRLPVLYIDISGEIFLRMQDAEGREIKFVWEELDSPDTVRQAIQMASDALRGPYMRGRRGILVQLVPTPRVTLGTGF